MRLADPYALAYPESAPFWQAAETGTLLLPQCVRCECFIGTPRVLPFLQGPDPRWTASSGQGEIFSFSVARTATPLRVVAYVRLAEGPLMLTNIVDCDPDGVRIGQRVSARFRPTQQGRLLPGVRPGARSRQGLETCIPEIASPVAVSCWPGALAWPSREAAQAAAFPQRPVAMIVPLPG